jgi:hypothetical protein
VRGWEGNYASLPRCERWESDEAKRWGDGKVDGQRWEKVDAMLLIN